MILFEVLNKTVLDSLSVRTSLNRSLRKIKVSDLTSMDIALVMKDLNTVRDNSQEILKGLDKDLIGFRVKSRESVKLKIKKYSSTYTSALICFNDLLGIRVYVDKYPDVKDIPDYFTYVDLTNGKQIDDGYRAMHLYYEVDNYHYRIEIQLILTKYRLFYHWLHIYGYKTDSASILLNMLKRFDNNEILTEEDFIRVLDIERILGFWHSYFGVKEVH